MLDYIDMEIEQKVDRYICIAGVAEEEQGQSLVAGFRATELQAKQRWIAYMNCGSIIQSRSSQNPRKPRQCAYVRNWIGEVNCHARLV